MATNDRAKREWYYSPSENLMIEVRTGTRQTIPADCIHVVEASWRDRVIKLAAALDEICQPYSAISVTRSRDRIAREALDEFNKWREGK